MRHIFSTPRWKDSIAYSLVLDGAGADTIVAEALGSRRFEVIVRGPGGHSWSDFGAPNPIVILAKAIETFTATPVPTSPKTTFNIGVIRGGTSVNSIPESASMKVDIRSTSMAEMERLEQSLRLALSRAVEDETMTAEMRSPAQKRPSGVSCEIVVDRKSSSRRVAAGRAHAAGIAGGRCAIANSAQVQRASTDANIPLSLGLEAVAIGGGGSGGGAHTLQEWFDSNGRELASETNIADDAGTRGGGGMRLNVEDESGAVASLAYAILICILSACGSRRRTLLPRIPGRRPICFSSTATSTQAYPRTRRSVPFCAKKRLRCGAIASRPSARLVDLEKLKGPQTQVVDLGGHFVMPGFNDAHLHLADAGTTKLSVDLTGVKSLDEFRNRVAKKVEEAKAGEWILGLGMGRNTLAGQGDAHAVGSG